MKRKLKITFITWLFPKISETFILNQIIFLLDSGFDVKIFAIKDARKDIPKEDREPEKVAHPLFYKYKLFLKTKYHSSIDDLANSLYREVKAGTLDLLYFQFSDIASEVLSRKEFNIPTVSVIHDLPVVNKKSRKIIVAKFKSAFDKTTTILAISDFTKRELIKLGCPANKIVIHQMGVSPKIFRPSRSDSAKSQIRFSMIGRFVPKKGFEIGLKSIHQIKKKNPRLKITVNLVGDGILRKKLENMVRKLKLEKEVKFLGKLTQSEVIEILKNTDILLCPNITTKNGKREGLPVVLIEAGLMNIPIVATRHAAIPEFAKETKSIVLAKEKSVDSFTLAMEKVLKNYDNFISLANESRENIVKTYGITNLGKRLIKIFRQTQEKYNLGELFKTFIQSLEKSSKKQIACIFIVGSFARGDRFSKFSDLDLVIVFRDKMGINYKSFLKLKGPLSILQDKLGKPIVLQLFNEFDFYQMVSPVLLKEYLLDGKVIFGDSFFKNVRLPSIRILEIGVLKRVLFLRYLVRQKVATDLKSLKEQYEIAKVVLFLAKYLVWVKKREYPTHQLDVTKFFNAEDPHHKTIKEAVAVTSESKIPSRKIIELFINFIEEVCDEIIKVLQKRYQKINVGSF